MRDGVDATGGEVVAPRGGAIARRLRSPSLWDHVVTGVLTAAPLERAGDVIVRIGEHRAPLPEVSWVVDPEGHLLGAVALDELVEHPAASLDELMDPGWPRVTPDASPEEVASEALDRGRTAVAVVDRDGRLLGAVPPAALLHILRAEHVEDLHRLAGIRHQRRGPSGGLEDRPLRRARDRLPWLLVGLAGSLIAAGVVDGFGGILSRNIVVAAFVPMIVYLADAVGAQTVAIAVRALSLARVPLRGMLSREVRTGVLLGVTLAALAYPAVWLLFGDARLAFAVSAALFVASTVATSIGLLFPWTIWRLGGDPALGSGPVATIVQDILSLIVYLAIASALMD